MPGKALPSRIRCAVFPPLRRRATIFPPLRRGGWGGGPGTTSHGRFPRFLPLSPFASLSRSEKNRSRPTRLLHHPPPTPPSQGGERRSHAKSFQCAQQKIRLSKPSLQLGELPLFITPVLSSLHHLVAVGGRKSGFGVGMAAPIAVRHAWSRWRNSVARRVSVAARSCRSPGSCLRLYSSIRLSS